MTSNRLFKDYVTGRFYNESPNSIVFTQMHPKSY